MSEPSVDILNSGDIEFFIQNLKPSSIENLGSPLWVESHHRLQKLGQQAAIEVGEMREETVKDFIVSYGKVVVIVHEAICIQVWREKVLTQIMKLKNQPPHTFVAYIILFHEVTAVSLLENVLYHRDAFQGLTETSIDLIDYCTSEIVRLLSEDYASLEESSGSLTNLEEIKLQSKTIGFNIGLSCISILRYLIEFMEELPLCAISRIYKTHDIPVLLSNLIQISPWRRINSKTNVVQIYEERAWKNIDKIQGISKYEGQCWIALRLILLDENSRHQYEINEFRKQHLLKIQKCLKETIIDQIPPLMDLNRFLAQLTMSAPPTQDKKPLIMETIPEIKSTILKDFYKKRKKILTQHFELMFSPKKEDMMEVAKRLGETYDIDHLERLVPEGPICSNCGDAASKRCSQCKNEWYCGRECQVKRWAKHKSVCKLLTQPKGEGDR